MTPALVPGHKQGCSVLLPMAHWDPSHRLRCQAHSCPVWALRPWQPVSAFGGRGWPHPTVEALGEVLAGSQGQGCWVP